MYKNQLQELAQRSCFNLPAYSCIREGPDHAPRFKAKVNFNGEIFESPSFCSNLRQAEHAAAEVALISLSQRGPSRALAARVLDETGIYKNLLQETAHRAGLKLPVYSTIRAGPAYAPLFTCTVELGGMSFAGEPAKTKKQAQKTAAMAAWSSLKNLAQESSSSSGSGTGGKDEQQQVVVARYLARFKLPGGGKSFERDRRNVKQEIYRFRRDEMRYSAGRSFYEVQHQMTMYPHFFPEVAMYQQVPQQQSHVLALPSASTSIARLQSFPFVPSRPYSVPMEQAPASFTPSFGQVFYFSSNMIPLSIRTSSHVTIEEMEESTLAEDEQFSGETNSPWWRTSSPSRSAVSPANSPQDPESINRDSGLRMDELWQQKVVHEKDESSNDVSKTSHSKACQNVHYEQIQPGFIPNTLGEPHGDASGQHPRSLSISGATSPHVQIPYHSKASTSRLNEGPLALPLTYPRRGLPSFSTSFTCDGSNTTSMPRNPVYPPSTRPLFNHSNNFRGLSCASSMAPAVQIRSVVPMCSAPPPRRNPTTSQDERVEGTEEGITSVSSEFCRLQM